MDNNSSVYKTMKILIRLAKEPYKMTALELSRELNINRSTIHRNLNAFISELIVIQNPETKMYSLGPTAYHIGACYLSNIDYNVQIRYILNNIAMEAKQSVGFSVLEGKKIFNIMEIESYQPIKIGYRQGNYFPFHCGAYGKSIMAFYEPYEELVKIVNEKPLEKRTENTITDPDLLLLEYQKIRDNGYAISDGENMYGVIGIGAPVKNSKGKIVGSVATAIIKHNTTNEDIMRLKELMISGADEISQYVL